MKTATEVLHMLKSLYNSSDLSLHSVLKQLFIMLAVLSCILKQ